MTDRKFTDDEIIKAAECCILSNTACDCEDLKCPACYEKGCVYFNRSCADGEYEVYCEILKDALALINRQNAEIESLKKIGDNKTSEILRHATAIGELHKQLETAKSEAIKEFAENVKAIFECVLYFDDDVKECILNEIDELVKEMTE